LVEIIAPDIPAPRGHFAHAVKTETAVYVSGLLALDQEGQIRDPDDPAAQTRHIMASLDSILVAAGVGREDVTKLTIYVVDIADRVAVGDARADYFGRSRPSSTLVEVSALAAPGAKVEIEAIVNVPRR
jgi:enamine deaminase RidA (YjgF/YER057c/UK114 family)